MSRKDKDSSALKCHKSLKIHYGKDIMEIKRFNAHNISEIMKDSRCEKISKIVKDSSRAIYHEGQKIHYYKNIM